MHGKENEVVECDDTGSQTDLYCDTSQAYLETCVHNCQPDRVNKQQEENLPE